MSIQPPRTVLSHVRSLLGDSEREEGDRQRQERLAAAKSEISRATGGCDIATEAAAQGLINYRDGNTTRSSIQRHPSAQSAGPAMYVGGRMPEDFVGAKCRLCEKVIEANERSSTNYAGSPAHSACIQGTYATKRETARIVAKNKYED